MTTWYRFEGRDGSQVALGGQGSARPVIVDGEPLRTLRGIVDGTIPVDALVFGPTVDVTEISLIEPLGYYPRNLFCVGKNYREHATEFSASGYDSSSAGQDDVVPSAPIVFSKPATAVIGPGCRIESHAGLTSEVDYEAELAVVIGRGGRAIGTREAMDHVFGYTIVNDVTARDLQRRHRQWLIGKSLDSFCPIGPAVVTADELDLATAVISCSVNGEVRQHAAIRDLIFDIPTLIATISAGISLVPGDVIATGTPAGVGIGFEPPRFLGPGDEIAVTLTAVGTLINTIG